MNFIDWFTVVTMLICFGQTANANETACGEKRNAKMALRLTLSNIDHLGTSSSTSTGIYQPFTNIHCSDGACSFALDSSVIRKYEPDHVHASADGFVSYPNIDLMTEMKNAITASRRYESAAKACSEDI